MRMNSSSWIKLKGRISYSKIVLFGIALLLMVVVFSYQLYENKDKNLIRGTRAMLLLHRSKINMYFEIYGWYPQSLDEFWRGFNDEYGSKKFYVAFKFQSENKVTEHRELNGQGGYYYNPDTGEIKLNFTKPVKEYFFRYRGKYADEIPSSW